MISRLPLFVILLALSCASMLVPASYALTTNDHETGRPFLYAAILFGFLTGLLALAISNRQSLRPARDQLLTLLAAFTVLPIILAVPFTEAVPDMSFSNGYFEMVSSLTTTGASMFDRAGRLSDTLHLWRALVAWMGGFLMLISAMAILAPMNLAGFEVLRTGDGSDTRRDRATAAIDMDLRLSRYAGRILPLYVGATLALWFILALIGTDPFLAFCLALSTLSTSGILPPGGMPGANIGALGELIVFGFLMIALSRVTLSIEPGQTLASRLRDDRELRMALIFVGAVTIFLFMRHWIGALEVDDETDLIAGIQALWGGLFTVLSFLTTTGFISADWEAAQAWSGLPTPGLIMAGLAIIGGGVATTAGGVKLLRVYVLYKHGLREMERLVHPSSIGGAGFLGRDVRRQGAFLAWIFFMLFALSIAGFAVALALTGLGFETALIFAISALSNTGPLADLALSQTGSYRELSGAAQGILLAAMVLGRLETLAIIALFNPDFWRH